MKTLTFLKQTAVMLAALNLVLPLQWVMAENPSLAVKTPDGKVAWNKASDVTLGERGRLTGQVLNASGQPQIDVAVRIEQGGKKLGEVKTNQQGRFEVEGVRGGVCNLQVGTLTSACRCWTPESAPPAAKPGVLVISDPQLERGQRPINEILTNPLLIGAVIAAAIAIPLAIHNSQKNGSGS